MNESRPIMVRFKLGDYFHTGSHKVAISLPDLTSQTNNFSIKNRPGCAPSLLKSSPKDLFLDYNVKCNLKDSDPSGHDVKVHFDTSQVVDSTTAKNLDVAVSCSCPAFLYWGAQWNAYQRDALEGEPRPLLTAPTERLDLRDDFVICKHVKAVSERILPSVQHNIVKILRQRKVEESKKEEKPFQLRPTLEDRQRDMRERQLKKKKKSPTKDHLDVRKQLEEGLSRRDPKADDVIQRDTPATPEEKARVPVIEPSPLPPEPQLAPIPELEDDVVIPEPEPVPPPPPVKPAPQKPKELTPAERQQMNRLKQEEQRRMQREEQRRLDRQTQQRLRSNPGRR